MFGLFIAAFFSFGITLVLVGANQAALADAMQLDLEQTGLLGSALALGAGVGIGAAGPLFDRHGGRALFTVATLFPAVALLSVHAEMGYWGAFVRILVAGLGAGAYNTVVNASLTERYGDAAARPLAVVHASATVGAMLGPALSVWLASRGDWTTTFHLAGVAHVLLAMAAALLPLRWTRPVARTARARPSAAALFPLLCIAFGYVAIEGTSTVFAVPYAMETLGLDAARGQYAISALWLGVLAGRLALLAFGRRLGLRSIAVAGVVTAAVVMGGVLADVGHVEVLFAAIGFSVGGVYPLTMAVIGERFVEARGTAAGLAGAAGAVGAVVAPWLTGAAGDRWGMSVGVLSMGGWAVLIVVGALIAWGRSR